LPLNEKAVGALFGLPILLLATTTVFGSLLISRLGARRALALALVLVGAGGALRGLGPSLPMLFAMTLIMGVGVAIAQPSLPSLVALWAPDRVGLATAAFSNGFLVGETLPAALTVPFVVRLFGGSWEAALAFWSIPVLATAALVIALTPHQARAAGVPPPRWWPDWRKATTWQLGLFLGGASAAYFGFNSFLPDYLRAVHRPESITLSLTLLNLLQLPASLIIAAVPGAILGRRWPFIATGVLTAAAAVAFGALSGLSQAVAAGVVGFAAAFAFMLVLAMPPLMAEAGDVHRLTAGITTIQYATAFLAPLLAGAIWDATGQAASAWLLVVVAGLAMTLIPIPMRLGSVRRAVA